jgi:H+/Cl- antiporter ClcA
MTKKETGFLLIGLGIGLTLALLVINEVFKSLVGGARVDSYSFERVLIVIPSLLLVAGATLVLWKPRKKRESKPLAIDSDHGHETP